MSKLVVNSIDLTYLKGELSVPGDKSISHRSVILGGLASGVSRIENFLTSQDCLHTLKVMQALGAKVKVLKRDEFQNPISFEMTGVNQIPKVCETDLDCGNSGTSMRLLTGVLAGQSFSSRLIGDASLSSRPMRRVITPLEQMGASIVSVGEKAGCAPLEIAGCSLQGIDYQMTIASAQVKSAILLAGLSNQGDIRIKECAVTRDHTERMLKAFGIDVNVDGLEIFLRGGQKLKATDVNVPGDISSAAFWLVAVASTPGAIMTLKNVGLNPTRTAILKVLERMGADLEIKHTSGDFVEPFGDIAINGKQLRGVALLEDEIPNLIDEIPILSIAGARAEGLFNVRNAKELRVKESDRISTAVENLRKMGVKVQEFEDGFQVEGTQSLKGAQLASFGDHRIAMAFAIAGLFAEGQTVIHDSDCIQTSYPGFEGIVRSFFSK